MFRAGCKGDMTMLPNSIPNLKHYSPERPIVWISEEKASRIATASLAYQTTMETLRIHARGDFDQPLKPYVRSGGRLNESEGGRLTTMSAYVGDPFRALGAKLVTGFPINVAKGLPRASGVIVLFDPVTGEPIAIMGCQAISARRAAAIASICVDHLAPKDRLRIAILGAGPIAHETVISLFVSKPRPIDVVSIYDPLRNRAASIASNVSPFTEVPITVAQSAESCVAGANVIVTATTGSKAYIQADWLNGPWLVVALSLDDFVPEILLSADKLICDDFSQCNRSDKLFHKHVHSGALTRERVYAELGEIVSGERAGRENDETIFVNPMGMAIEDIALAARVYEITLEPET
jgi:ornithine cyclodeaminase/alanine dehydrogenase-like protein (mu-crystallin family)